MVLKYVKIFFYLILLINYKSYLKNRKYLIVWIKYYLSVILVNSINKLYCFIINLVHNFVFIIAYNIKLKIVVIYLFCCILF